MLPLLTRGLAPDADTDTETAWDITNCTMYRWMADIFDRLKDNLMNLILTACSKSLTVAWWWVVVVVTLPDSVFKQNKTHSAASLWRDNVVIVICVTGDWRVETVQDRQCRRNSEWAQSGVWTRSTGDHNCRRR